MRHLKTPIEGYEYHIILSEEEKEILKKQYKTVEKEDFVHVFLIK